MAATVTGILLTGNHASRPTTGLSAGTLYSCTTHSKIYQTSDTGSTWADWLGPFGSSTTTIANDTIWAAKGDIVGATGNDAAAVLTVGSNDTILMADSTASNGLKWVASATPSTQAFGDSAAVGTGDTFTRGDHKHAMPANPSDASITVTDVTTNNASTSAHGFLKKLDNNAGHFMDGTGAWSVPSGATDLAGKELDYVEYTSGVNITATTEATANTIVTGSAVAYDGATVVMIEFYVPYSVPETGAANRQIVYWLYDGSSSIGALGYHLKQSAATERVPLYLARRLTPSNATHTYSVRGSVNAGTGAAQAGAGGNGNDMPGFIRIYRVTS